MVLVAIFLGLSSCDEAVVTNPYNATLVFEQIDLNLDGNIVTNSDWGSVVLTHDGSSQILYFNLAVNSVWVIQNVPIMSFRGPGVSQEVTLWFDLGVPTGTDVTQLQYVFDLTTNVSNTMPTTTLTGEGGTATVSDRSVTIYSGRVGGSGITPKEAENETGGEVVSFASHEGNFEGGDYNQNCGKWECTPTAVSNSLKWLKDKHDLTYPEDPTIESMKGATDWDDGCGFDWWMIKAYYMNERKYPITTTITNDLDAVIDAIAAGKDVELNGDWYSDSEYDGGHTAMVVGMAKVNVDGATKYVIWVAHDTDQDKDHPDDSDLRVEKTIYNPSTGRFETGPFAGAILPSDGFVIECPE